MPKRVQARVPDDVYERLLDWSNRFGVTLSQLGGMAIQAGMDSIVRAVAPAESLSPEQWARIVKAMEAEGLKMAEKGKEDA